MIYVNEFEMVNIKAIFITINNKIITAAFNPQGVQWQRDGINYKSDKNHLRGFVSSSRIVKQNTISKRCFNGYRSSRHHKMSWTMCTALMWHRWSHFSS